MIVAVTPAVSALAQALVMPKQLVEVARSKSCEPVSDFFDREGLYDPPYAIGYLPGNKEGSAIFFCRRGNDYFIVIAVFDSRLNFSCPTEIPYPGAPPEGLRILHGKKVPLDWFRYMEPHRGYGPKHLNTTGPIIEEDFDGVLNWFYCHNGRWLHRFLH